MNVNKNHCKWLRSAFYINDKDIERNKVAVSKFERKRKFVYNSLTGRSYLDLQK